MLAPLLFALAPQWPPQFFHSRIATGSVMSVFIDLHYAECVCLYYGLLQM